MMSATSKCQTAIVLSFLLKFFSKPLSLLLLSLLLLLLSLLLLSLLLLLLLLLYWLYWLHIGINCQ